MEHNIKKFDEIWTADGKKLGIAYKIFHRQEEVNPDLQLYESYISVVNFEYGEEYFVPTDFIEGRDPETGNLLLSIPFARVMDMTCFRMPDFVMHRKYDLELLTAPQLG